jgi:MoxR-like ATPase
MALKERIKELLARLNDGVIEKEETIALALLSAVAGESIFLLGPPGVAKSLIARRLKCAFKDGTAFEYLMNRFSTPDEIFGPISISKLKNEDKYERIVKNYLPDATVVFLDEIWKAGPSIQNTLLTVLNEKIYRNGENEIKLPMKAIISASNELPTKDEGLEALWDRFLVRLFVEGVQDKENFNKMISESLKSYEDTIGAELKINDDEYKAWNEKIDEIKVPENVFNVIQVIRARIEDENSKKGEGKIYISDRRWRKIIRLLRTSAFLNDRDSVDLMDCFLITNCLWDEVEQTQAVSQFVDEAIQKHGYTIILKPSLREIADKLKELDNDVKKETVFIKEIQIEEPKLIENEYYEIDSPDLEKKYIKKKEYDNLNNAIQEVVFHGNNSTYYQRRYNVSKSRKNYINIQGREYKLKTVLRTDRKRTTRKPHSSVQKNWNREIKIALNTTRNLRAQISSFRTQDLKHIRTNLFVTSEENAAIVASHLKDLETEIEKLEIESNRIKHYYEAIED